MRKEFIINDRELMTMEWPVQNQQDFLKMLKDKGAPISGDFELEVEHGWQATWSYCPIACFMTVTFERTDII